MSIDDRESPERVPSTNAVRWPDESSFFFCDQDTGTRFAPSDIDSGSARLRYWVNPALQKDLTVFAGSAIVVEWRERLVIKCIDRHSLRISGNPNKCT